MDPIVQPEPLPISVSIPGGISPNRFVVVDGRVPEHAVRFSVRLQCGSSMSLVDDIAVSVGFIFRNDQTFFSVNSYLKGDWGEFEGTYRNENENKPSRVFSVKDEKEASICVPLEKGQYCGILLECRENCFSINVQSEHLYDYQHRTEYTRITYLVLHGDFKVTQAGVLGSDGPTKWLIYPTGLYEPWQHNVTVLNDEIFERKVIRTKDMWIVNFYQNRCRFHIAWEAAAAEIEKKRLPINLAVIDCLANLDTVLRVEITKCPTILCYLSGAKLWTSGVEYDKECSVNGFLKWAVHKFKGEPGDPPDLGLRTVPFEQIRMIQRDSWKEGPPTLLEGAGTPAGMLSEIATEFRVNEEQQDKKNTKDALVQKWLLRLNDLENQKIPSEVLRELDDSISGEGTRNLKLSFSMETMVLKVSDTSMTSKKTNTSRSVRIEAGPSKVMQELPSEHMNLTTESKIRKDSETNSCLKILKHSNLHYQSNLKIDSTATKASLTGKEESKVIESPLKWNRTNQDSTALAKTEQSKSRTTADCHHCVTL